MSTNTVSSTTPAPTAISSTAPPTNQTESTSSLSIPSAETLLQSARLAVQQDKRIMLDYYNDSKNDKAFIGQDPDSKERVLIKTKRDFTSLIQKLYQVKDDFLILTENSLYIVSSKIKMRKIDMSSLDYDYNDDE